MKTPPIRAGPDLRREGGFENYGFAEDMISIRGEPNNRIKLYADAER